jgi:hypothetical protein
VANHRLAPGVSGGPGSPVLYFVVNGIGPFSDSPYPLETGFVMGVPGCPFPFASVLKPGMTVSGCVALAVPVGVKVSTVGFDLQPTTGRPVEHVAQWAV